MVFHSCHFFGVIPISHAEYISKNSNLWENLMHSAIKTSQASGLPMVSMIQGVAAFLEGDVCRLSSDGYHYSDTLISMSDSEDKYGRHPARAVCKYCNEEFWCFASDLQQSYDAQVQDLPATGFTSEGNLIWSPSLSDCLDSSFYVCNPYYSNDYFNVPANSSTFDYYVENEGRVSYEKLTEHSARVYGFSSLARTLYGLGFDDVDWLLPLDCSYKRISSFHFILSYRDSSGAAHTVSSLYKADSSYSFGSSGSVIERSDSVRASDLLGSAPSALSFSYTIYTPQFLVIPDTTLPSDTYNITSRPTSITGDYGIIGDNGQIVKVEGDKIVNETNNTYYNPATGKTDTIKDWSYNYEDRSYTLTLGGGTTTTVTYGDENVTIKEGDTVYNIYYLVDGSGTDTPDPGPGPDDPSTCDHTWTETGRTEPTCSTVGKVTFTCSKCNQTKTETIPALGHTWTVDRTVQTTYDEQGNLLQQGYTIYRCTVCGEQYKDMEGTGPPGEEDEKSLWEKLGDLIGTGLGGILDLVEAVLGKLLDALIALVDMLMGKLKTVVESILSIFDVLPSLFNGFLGFLSAVFPYLPPELMTILTFGVIAIVTIGIIKAVRR